MSPRRFEASGRAGLTLVEVVIGATLTAVVVTLTLTAFSRIAATVEELGIRAERLQAIRLTSLVLQSELGSGNRGADWWVHPPDSTRVRAFRGVARSCPPEAEPDSEVMVRWAGSRLPDPRKDSVVVLDGRGDSFAVDLVSVSAASGRCGPGTTPVQRWRLEPAPSDPVLLRVFERGSYHLSGDALRYRRGASGRQPLTTESLAGAYFEVDDSVLRLVVRDASDSLSALVMGR